MTGITRASVSYHYRAQGNSNRDQREDGDQSEDGGNIHMGLEVHKEDAQGRRLEETPLFVRVGYVRSRGCCLCHV